MSLGRIIKLIRLGKVDYLNCLPVYYGIERGIIPIDVDLFPGPPTELNKKFMSGELDITPISSIEYARNPQQCVILPNMSISADGRVTSILLFSKVPIEKLDGRTVTITTSSATSVAMLKILMEKYWKLNVKYHPLQPDLVSMMGRADAALLIGDDALRAKSNSDEQGLFTYDLGTAWKEYTGLPMVYALWVIKSSFLANHEEIRSISNAFFKSKQWGMNNVETLVSFAADNYDLHLDVIREHFAHIKHQFDGYYQKALIRYYEEAHSIGLIERVPNLAIWGDCNEY